MLAVPDAVVVIVAPVVDPSSPSLSVALALSPSSAELHAASIIASAVLARDPNRKRFIVSPQSSSRREAIIVVRFALVHSIELDLHRDAVLHRGPPSRAKAWRSRATAASPIRRFGPTWPRRRSTRCATTFVTARP